MTSGYPETLRAEARTLGDAGWEPTQIVRIFARRGVNPLPTPSAVRWWLSGSANFERQMEHQRRSKARRQARASGGRMLGKPRTPEFKLARIRALAQRNISVRSIAVLIQFDLGDPITESQVRRALERGIYPTFDTQKEAIAA